MGSLRRIAVFCGSSEAVDEKYKAFAREVGALFAKEGIDVVYGGGRVGLMGAVADGALEAGGFVLGVIPRRLEEREVAHRGLTELIQVDGMHARKQVMAGLSDAFVALPGGYGTLDELFEAVTWAQLGYHHKPCAFLDPFNFFDGLLAFIRHATHERFVRPDDRELLFHENDPQRLLVRLRERVQRPA